MAAEPHDHNPLPREIAAGIFWLGVCTRVRHAGEMVHAYQSVYLVTGERHSMLVEAGQPQQLPVIERQLEQLLADGAPPLRYVFTTHNETPHAGGVGRLLERFPDIEACGDVSDLHLVFPQFADRLRPLDPGDELDLGGSIFRVQEAVFVDFPTTRWGYDVTRKVLFTGDGFAYAHYHGADHCGRLAEEVPGLDVPGMAEVFAERAFYWTNFVDLKPYVERLEEMIFGELAVQTIAPTHGLPIGDPRATFPKVSEGLLRAGAELQH